MSNAPRNPRDLQALLRFCLETTRNEDAPASEGVAPMDPERQRWLQQALSDMSVDVFKELAKCIEFLSDEEVIMNPSSDVSTQLYALDCIEDWVGQIDMANSFHKLGGFVGLKLCLNSPHETLQSGSCHIIAELSQNNPYCQEKFVAEEIFMVIMNMLKESDSLQVKAKALYAISCIVRDFPLGEKELITEDGLTSIMNVLKTNDEKLVTKSCFLISSLLTTSTEAKTICTNMGFSQLLISLLLGPHNPSHEHMARALLLLSSDNEEVRKECLGFDVNFQHFLNERIAFVNEKEEFQEEMEYYKELLNLYFPSVTEQIER